MKFNPNEIFKKYPDIEDIAVRLEASEKEAKKKQKEKDKRGKGNNEPVPSGETGSKRVFHYLPEHAVISHYYKEGRWEQSPFDIKAGREAFLQDLAKILETRDPDAIKVEIFKGKTRKSDAAYTKDIYLSEDQPEPSPSGEENSELGSLVKKFDESLNTAKKNPGNSSFQIELLRKEFEAQLK